MKDGKALQFKRVLSATIEKGNLVVRTEIGEAVIPLDTIESVSMVARQIDALKKEKTDDTTRNAR